MPQRQTPKVLMLISGGETGGSRKHVLTLLKELSSQIPIHLVCLIQGPVYEQAMAAGLPVSLVEQASRRDMRVVRELSRRIAEEGYTIFHSHGGRANFVAATLKKERQKTGGNGMPLRFVTTIHSDIHQDYIHQPWWKRLLFTRLNLWALKRFDHYIAVSRTFAQQLTAQGFPAERISVVYNGIDLNDPAPAYSRQQLSEMAGLTLRPEDRLLIMVGRLHPVKDIPLFLKSLSLLLKENRPVKALVVGDGPERESLQQLVYSLDLASHVRLMGFREDVEALLASADLSVLTSRSESFPYVILESIKAGTPVVATRVGGIPDLLPEECLVEPGDVAGLTATLRALFAHPERLRQLSEQLQRRVREEFSLQTFTARHMAIYRDILKGA